MILTNKTNVPRLFFEAMEQLYNNHPKMLDDAFSATELLKPTKLVYLKRNMKEEDLKEVDIQEAMDLILGTMVHKGLETVFKNRSDCTSEKTLCIEFEVKTSFGVEKFKWVGTPDIVWEDENGDLWLIDWKTARQWSIDRQREGSDTYWKDQSYIYAHFLENIIGKRPKGAIFLGIMKDKMKSGINWEDLSTMPLQWVEYDLSDREYEQKVLEKARQKVASVKNIENGLESLPECNEEDRWQSPARWGTKRTDGKRWSYFDSKEEAQAYINGLKLKPVKGVLPTYEVREFPSEPRRCMAHCECINGCKQGQKLVDDFLKSIKAKDESN